MKTTEEIQSLLKETEEMNYRLRSYKEKANDYSNKRKEKEVKLKELGFNNIDEAKQSVIEKTKQAEEFIIQVKTLSKNIENKLKGLE